MPNRQDLVLKGRRKRRKKGRREGLFSPPHPPSDLLQSVSAGWFQGVNPVRRALWEEIFRVSVTQD